MYNSTYNPIVDNDIPDTIPYKPPKKKRSRAVWKNLRDQEKRFVRSYLQTFDRAKAAKEAGYKSKSKQGYIVRGSELLERPNVAEAIARQQERVQNILGNKVEKMLLLLSDLAENAESENVKLTAIKDWLDRAGYKPIERKEINNSTNIRVMDELAQRTQQLKHEKVVTIDAEYKDE